MKQYDRRQHTLDQEMTCRRLGESAVPGLIIGYDVKIVV
jgi:hypothetical protein